MVGVPVEVLPVAVVLCSRARVRVTSSDLHVAQGHAEIEAGRDVAVAQSVRGDALLDARLAQQPGDSDARRTRGHALPRGRTAPVRPDEQPPLVTVASRALELAEHERWDRHGRGSTALTDEAENSVAALGLGKVLDANVRGLGDAAEERP